MCAFHPSILSIYANPIYISSWDAEKKTVAGGPKPWVWHRECHQSTPQENEIMDPVSRRVQIKTFHSCMAYQLSPVCFQIACSLHSANGLGRPPTPNKKNFPNFPNLIKAGIYILWTESMYGVILQPENAYNTLPYEFCFSFLFSFFLPLLHIIFESLTVCLTQTSTS